MSKIIRQIMTNKKLTQKNILEHLEKIGLHRTDSSLYLASLTLGACTIKQLTKHTLINRITVHDGVQRLIDKGLLLETFSGKRRLVFPQQISNLQHLVDLKKTEVDQLQHNVSTTMGLLQSLHLQASYLPNIRITKGHTGIKELIADIHHRKQGVVKIISDSRHFDELLTTHFLEQIQKTNQRIEMILPAGFEHFIFSANAKNIPIKTKTLQEDSQRKGGMSLRENKVAFHAYEGVFITTTIIENEPISKMMQECFNKMR